MNKQKGDKPRTLMIEALEPRLLFSADLLAGAADNIGAEDSLAATLEDTVAIFEQQRLAAQQQGSDTPVVALADTSEVETVPAATELLFIDTRTPDYQRLIDDIAMDDSRQLEVVLIGAEDSGLQIINDTLATYQNLAAVHLVSHGSAGEVTLGSDTLSLESLAAQSAGLSDWQDSLAEDADLLIYGCNLAATEAGEQLIDTLASITGADVAASDDITGSVEQGGDWELEYRAGSVDTDVAFSDELQRDWAGTLNAEQLEADYFSTPLSFEQNAGQTDAVVDFLARGSGYTVFLSEADAVITLSAGEQSYVLRLNVIGADPEAAASGETLLASTSNYLTGNDSDKWQTSVDNYAAVSYDNVYEGIDLRYYGNQRELEYDFIVAAGADTSQIRLSFDGAHSVGITENGELEINLNGEGDSIRFKAPVSYQTAEDGSRISVASSYIINDDGSIGFELDEYDATKTLIIDPILDYGAYLGGTGHDIANGIAVDAAGNAYITGYTASTDFPTTTGAYDEVANGSNDIFVSKLSSDGTSLLYSTYIGGSGDDYANDIAIDSAGNVYITGNTESTDFAVVGGYQGTLNGTGDAVLLKLNAAGDTILYSTFFGGSDQQDEGYALALDTNDDVYIAGMTRSGDLSLMNAYDSTFAGSREGFVAKFDTTLTGAGSLLYSTYFGGDNQDQVNDIKVDTSGYVYLTGSTKSTDLPTTLSAYQSAKSAGGSWDGFLSKFDSADMSLMYSTYLGGNGDEMSNALAVDNVGNAYLGVDDGSDAFVWKIDTTQSGVSSLVYSISFGGTKVDVIEDITIDGMGRAYVAGYTLSNDFPMAGGPLDSLRSGSQDGFLTIIDAMGSSLEYSTYLGGPGANSATGITLDSQENIYIVGQAASQSFDNVTATSFGAGGGDDAFVLKFSSLNLTPVGAISDIDATADAVDENSIIGTTVGVTANATDPDGGDTVSYNLDDNAGGLFTIDTITGIVTVASAGLNAEAAASHNITIRATSSDNSYSTKTVSISVNDINEAPTDLDLSVSSIDENTDTSSGSVKVADITITDDALGSNDLTLSGTDAGSFIIVGTELHVRQGVVLDFETQSSYDLTITATDSVDGTLNYSEAFSIAVNDVNEAPTDLALSVSSIDENTDTGSSTVKVADITITDDALGSNDLTLSGTDAGSFIIVGTELHVRQGVVLDFETQSSYDLTIIATDSVDGTLNYSEAFSVAVNDVNEAPTDLSLSVSSIDENTDTSSGTVKVADITITDDALGSNDLTLSGTDAGSFIIVGTELHVRQGVVLDFETQASYDLTITATDSVDGTLNYSEAFSIAVNDVNEAPTDLALSVSSIDENTDTSSGTVKVADITVTDDALGSNNLALSGTDAGSFIIVGTELHVRQGVVLDFEAQASYGLTITATDSVDGTLNYSEAFSVAVNDVNEAPTDLSLSVSSIDENADTGSSTVKVADITVTDDALGSNDLTLSGTDAGSFIIVGTELHVRQGVVLDFETQASYDLTITATDSVDGTLNYSEAFSIAVNDVNEAPTDLALSVSSIDENTDTSSGTVKVADITITDDALGSNNLTLSGTDAGSFIIVGTELHVRQGVVLDFETQASYDLTITATDSVDGTLNYSEAFSIAINDVNEAPTDLALSVSSIDENADTGSSTVKVADITITDDALGSNNLTLSGTDAGSFIIVGTELHVRQGVVLDFETQASYDLTITATDSVDGTLNYSEAFSIAVNDVNEAPTDLSLSVSSIDENTDTGSSTVKVADITITDDALGSNDLTLSGTDAGSFIIVGTELHVRQGVVLDFETQSSYDLTITATDSVDGTLNYSEAFSIAINDVNEAPTDLDLSVTSIAENTDTSGGTIKVADITITDDALGSNNLTLSGTDAGSFIIVGTELHVRQGVVLDFETQASYDLTITATDSVDGTLNYSEAFSIAVNDVNEAPTDLALSVSSIDENADTGSSTVKVADITVTDDALGSNNLALSGTDAGSFIIVGNELHVRQGVVLDFETQANYDLTITATDSVDGTMNYSEAFSIAVNDVNEAPTDLDLSVTSIAENTDTSGGTVKVADITVTDDALGSNDLTLSGADASRFKIIGSELHVKRNVVVDFETQASYDLTITATDSVDGMLNYSESFSIAVDNVNDAPTDLDLSANSIDENTDTSGGTVKVADITVIDDVLGINNLSLSGTDAGSFIIVGTELHVKQGVVLDHETKDSYDLTITATDSVDGTLNYSEVFSISVNDVNDLPLGLQVITGAAEENQTLIVDTSGISDDDGLGSFNYQWLRNGSAISGANSDAHQLDDADVGNQISIEVAYTDANGTDEMLVSGQTAAVSNINDLPVGRPAISGIVRLDQTLTANTSSISDDDGLGSFSYQWLRDGAAISGADNATYLLQGEDFGAKISVQVSYVDAFSASEMVTSTQTPPVANVLIPDEGGDSEEPEEEAEEPVLETEEVDETTGGFEEDSSQSEQTFNTEESVSSSVTGTVDLPEAETVSPLDSAALLSVVTDVSADRDAYEYQERAIKPIPPKTIDLRNLDIASYSEYGNESAGVNSLIDNRSFVADIEVMKLDLDNAVEDSDARYQLGGETAIGITMSISAWFAIWMFRAGSLLACFLSVVPLWMQLDPLPVLGAAKGKKDKPSAGDSSLEDDRVDDLFRQQDSE